MRRILRTAAAAAATLALGYAQADTATFYFSQDIPYLSTADIPLGFYEGGAWSYLENFETGSLGGSLSMSAGSVIGPGQFDGLRDSVDADDNAADGACGPQSSKCHDWFYGSGPTGITITFTGAVLPTAFGLVWTDGGDTVTFSAKDGNDTSLGAIVHSGFADASSGGTTGEDRFFGATFAGGIKSIFIKNSSGGIEIDHVQYGTMASAVPEPGTSALWLAGLAVLGGVAIRRPGPGSIRAR